MLLVRAPPFPISTVQGLRAQQCLSCVQVQGTVTTFEITNLPKGTEPRQLVDILDEGGFTDQFDMLLLGRENEDGHTTIINFRWAQFWIAKAVRKNNLKKGHTDVNLRWSAELGSGWWLAAMLVAGWVCPPISSLFTHPFIYSFIGTPALCA